MADRSAQRVVASLRQASEFPRQTTPSGFTLMGAAEARAAAHAAAHAAEHEVINDIRVVLEGNTLRIEAWVDAKGLKRLKRIIEANEALIADEESPVAEQRAVPEN